MFNVYVYPGLDSKVKTVFRRKAGIRKKILTYEEIVNVVADVYNIKPKDIIGTSRVHNIIRARTCAQAVIRKVLGHSYSEISTFFNACNHTTPMYNIKKSDVWLNVYPTYAREYNVVLEYCLELQKNYEQNT